MSCPLRFLLPTLLALAVLACNLPLLATSGDVPTVEPLTLTLASTETATALLTPSPMPSATSTATATPSPTPSLTPRPSPTATATPYGCLKPPDDMTRVTIGEHVLTRRTVAMLEHAQELYGGSLQFLAAITQGSYTPGLAASFGTHDGGGAVDLSVRHPQTGAVLYADLEAMIRALRLAGFAAWVRYEDDLYPGSPIHIHAIAIGDPDLSPAARDQINGPAGYLRGFDGMPVDPPQPDRHGGPILCPWMEEMGYRDLRSEGS